MHIERQDAARVALAFFLLMLVVGSYTVVKSVRDAVFLSRFGVTELSLLSIGLAAAMSLIVGLYLRLTSNISHNTLLIGTYGIVAASLGGIAFGLGSQKLSSFMPWVLYVWSSIFGVFTIMQFWLLASGLFDPRGAKRFFGTIGSGAIVGGMGGGLLSRLLAVHLSPGALLWVAGSMLIMAAALAKIVWPMRQRERLRKRGPKMPEKGGGPSALRESPYLRLIAMSVLMATIVATLLDWQFKGIVKVEFAGRTDEMVRFFGGLYGYISLTALVLQISVTGWVLRRFGLIFGLFFLPVSLFIGSSGILFSAMLPISGLMAASIAKVADGGVRFAIGKVSMELLWLPVGRRLKERGKAFVDTVIDRVGTGVTGLIWLVLAFLGLTSPGRLHLISALSMIFVLGWMVVVYRTRKAYVVALRKTIEDRNLRLDDLRSNVVDLQTNNSIAELLGSGEGAKVHFALYLLANVSHTLPDLATLLIGKDTSLKMAAWRLVGMKEDRRYRKLAVQTLLDDTFETRRVVLGYLRVTSKIASGKCLSEASSDDAMVSLALNVARLSVPKVEARAAEAFRAFIASKGEDDAIVAIDLLSEAPPRAAAALLLPLLREDRRGRRRAAIRSAGRSKAIETLAPLLSLLDDHHWRPWVKTALMDMGSSVAEALVGVLSDANARPKAAEATATLLDILGASPSPSAAAILMAYCDKDQDKRISSAALGGLVRLRKEYRYDTERATVFEILGQEVSELAQNLLALDSGSWTATLGVGVPEGLFKRALYEEVQRGAKRVFDILSLAYDPKDMRAVYRGSCSASKAIRAGALELLDNVVAHDARRWVMAVVEEVSAFDFKKIARSVFGKEPEEKVILLRRAMRGKSDWLRIVGLWEVGQGAEGELEDEVARWGDGFSKKTSEVARRALEEMHHGKVEERAMGLTVVEKVLKLQGVDVLKEASTEDLAYVAQIAEEVETLAGEVIYNPGDLPDGLYVILSGEVKLHRGSEDIANLGSGESFGSWALLDGSPRVASATMLSRGVLLRVDRDEFIDVMGDRVELVQAIFKAAVARLRNLASEERLQG